MDLNSLGKPRRHHLTSSSTGPMFPDSNYPSNNFFNNQDHISPQPPLYGNTLNSQIPGYQFPISQTLQPSSADMFSNQQFLMAAGQQLLSNPITAAAIDAYSQSLADKSKGWMGNFKQYFAVDTNYALKKLLLIFLPFFHKDWSIRYNSENVAPRDEPNLPDLYIPSMAFITYVLISGYILGLKNQFAPEQLGIYASSALAWLIIEVVFILFTKYLFHLSSTFGFFHMLAFGGYKFVCIDAILLLSILFGNTGFFIFFLYSSLSLGYFLLRALSINLQQSQQSTSYQQYEQNPRTAYYLVIFIAFLQPFIIYCLTSSLANFTIAKTVETSQ